MISPHRLRILKAVLAAGSLHAAARNLHYSPATVSQHMTELARETGLDLFIKHGRGLMPTPAALQLAEHAEDALAELDRLERTAEDLRRGRTRQLTLASFSSAAKEWLPHVVTAVRRESPEVTVEISLNETPLGRSPQPVDLDLRQESLEAPEERLEGYLRYPLGVEEFDVALPAGHRLESYERVPMHELRDELWIDHDIYETPATRIIRSACRAAGFSPNVVARLDDHYAALSLVGAGVGITVLTRLALQDAPARVSIRALEKPQLQRRVVAHVRQDRGSTRPVTVALETLRTLAAEAGLRPED
ncbi:LysR family transcriptional regulator [Nesterenkonia flava]|uniref:LysR family transcriptional regulator n=1 Tax=Nesterenkonia flava TaxID=469799 RepID=A0ABU1FS39_9MICC|nr:LysR family transcriptional regulator [Nesterenkonia flava]MDR5711485.1 LysR family transcriptional regulator [Nesterenkonia flava]